MPMGCLWGPETHLPVGQMQLGTEAVWQMPGANPEQGSPAPAREKRGWTIPTAGTWLQGRCHAVNTGVSVMVER